MNETEMKRKISRVLLNARRTKKLKIGSIAEATGISAEVIKMIEFGFVYPSPHMIKSISKAYGIDYEELIALNKPNSITKQFLLLHSSRIFIKLSAIICGFIGLLVMVISFVSDSIQIVANVPEVIELLEKTPPLMEPSVYYLSLIEDPFDQYPNRYVAEADQQRNMYAYEEAIKSAQEGLQVELKKTNPDKKIVMKVKSMLGALYFIIGDFNNAIKQYSEAILLAEKDSISEGIISYNLARIYQQMGQSVGVDVLYKDAIHILYDSDYILPILCNAARNQMKYENFDNAKKMLNGIRAKYDVEEAIFKFGADKASDKEMVTLIDVMITILEYNQHNALISNNEFDMEITGQSLMDFIDLINVDILTKVYVHNLLIYNYAYKNNYEKAEEMNSECKKLLELYLPNYLSARYDTTINSVWLLYKQGNIRDARIQTESLLQLWKDNHFFDIDYYFRLADIIDDTDSGFAITVLKSLSDQKIDSSSSIRLYEQIGYIYYYLLEDTENAIEYYTKAIRIADSSQNSDEGLSAYFALCVVYFIELNPDLALMQCRKMINHFNLDYQAPSESFYSTEELSELFEKDYTNEDVEAYLNGAINMLDYNGSKIAYSFGGMIYTIYQINGLPADSYEDWWRNAQIQD